MLRWLLEELQRHLGVDAGDKSDVFFEFCCFGLLFFLGGFLVFICFYSCFFNFQFFLWFFNIVSFYEFSPAFIFCLIDFFVRNEEVKRFLLPEKPN